MVVVDGGLANVDMYASNKDPNLKKTMSQSQADSNAMSQSVNVVPSTGSDLNDELAEDFDIASRVQEVFQHCEKARRESRQSKEANSSILVEIPKEKQRNPNTPGLLKGVDPSFYDLEWMKW